MDDFGLKYFNEDDANHLIKTLQNYNVITIDRKGENYCGLTFKWNYKDQYVDASMPGYVKKALAKYGHTSPKKPQYAPHIWASKNYGIKPQQATPIDTSKKLPQKEINQVQ